ncbi:Protein phosphatase 1 regulatory subunit 37 Leucine-rich repeat-containing protein 68 [Channa argus]|uniref:Protein phosphatase 1 regulatory subunit 37 n=1 Tax=Channa argus TaxID=215402 RepID=A0A6G1QGW1_CHAAH|nr:Protein phosphatase 1 regulatory subunit 37 Leucine-rich repeat-containing protein 68 [Channa argus]
MTRCSDKENEKQGDNGAENPNEKWEKRRKGGKHVSFPPDEQIVSGFAEHRNTDRMGERLDHRSCEALEVVLKSLHFDFINLQAAQLEENGASSLLDMILYYESTTHLDISDNSSMGTSVGALKTNKALQELHLSSNLLNSYQDALQLGDLLRYNNTLKTLELSNNALADAGLEELCDGLRWQTTGLKVLLLKNNHITAKGMVHLAKTLPVLKVLQVLDLGENLLGNEGIQVIREPLMVNCSVLQLSLAQTNITCEGAVALAEFLAENHHIECLDLRKNEVKLGGLMALCLALRINRSLASLDLDHITPQEQDEFLRETHTRLRLEITQRCLANGRLSGLAVETPEMSPSEAYGPADSMTAT